jgi:hypothetical protein
MPRGSQDRTFDIYEVTINVIVRRKEDRYSSDVLARVENTEEIPLVHDADLQVVENEVAERLNQTRSKIRGLLRARGNFEVTTLAITAGGDVIDA